MTSKEFKKYMDDYLVSLGLPTLSGNTDDFYINIALNDFYKDGVGCLFPEFNIATVKEQEIACYFVAIKKEGIEVKIQIGNHTGNQIFVINPTPERLDLLVNALNFSKGKTVTQEEIAYYQGICANHQPPNHE